MRLFFKVFGVMNTINDLMERWPAIREKLRKFKDEDPDIAFAWELLEKIYKKIRR